MKIYLNPLCYNINAMSSGYWKIHQPVVFMSWVERLGRTLSETVGVGEEGDCGAGVHNDMSTLLHNKTCKTTINVSFIHLLFFT